MDSLFGLPPNAPRHVVKPRSITLLTSQWHAVYRHNPKDPNSTALIPVIGIAAVEVTDTQTGDSITSFRPYVIMPNGEITDAVALDGFVCLVSDDQLIDEEMEDHIKDMVAQCTGDDD